MPHAPATRYASRRNASPIGSVRDSTLATTVRAAPAQKAEPKKSASEKDSDKERRKREAEQQELAMVKERLRFAEAAEREAVAAIERAKRGLERAERTRERIEAELAEATKVEKLAQKELDASESAHGKAVNERDRLRKKAGA